MRQISLAIVVSLGLILIGCAKSEPPATVATVHVDPVLNARAQSILGISLPCTLITCIPYMGGNSAGGSLGGFRGEVLKFAFGPALADSVVNPDTVFVAATGKLMVEVDSLTPARPYVAYIGANYPTRTGATPLAVNSPAESVFIDVLRTAVLRERGPAGSQHQDAASATLAGVITVLDRQRSLGTPRPAAPTNP